MRIGIDIDGVIADTIGCCAKAVSEFLGCEITGEDIIYRYGEMYHIHDFWRENANKFLCSSNPMEGVCEHISNLVKSHELYFISARGEELLSETKTWFQNYCLPSSNIYLTSGRTKTTLCKELNLDMFIEDSPKEAAEITDLRIPVFLLDTDYNRDFNKEGVIRCKNWDELMRKISEIK